MAATLTDDQVDMMTKAFQTAQQDIINQDLILSGTGNVQITLMDGSKKTVPSWDVISKKNGFMESTTALSATSNLNSLTGDKSGFYWNSQNSYGTTANNYPVARAGALLVMSNAAYGGTSLSCTQLYFPFDDVTTIYNRLYIAQNGTTAARWTQWTKISTNVAKHLDWTKMTAGSADKDLNSYDEGGTFIIYAASTGNGALNLPAGFGSYGTLHVISDVYGSNAGHFVTQVLTDKSNGVQYIRARNDVGQAWLPWHKNAQYNYNTTSKAWELQFDASVPVAKGGTGASNTRQAVYNLQTGDEFQIQHNDASSFVTTGKITTGAKFQSLYKINNATKGFSEFYTSLPWSTTTANTIDHSDTIIKTTDSVNSKSTEYHFSSKGSFTVGGWNSPYPGNNFIQMHRADGEGANKDIVNYIQHNWHSDNVYTGPIRGAGADIDSYTVRLDSRAANALSQWFFERSGNLSAPGGVYSMAQEFEGVNSSGGGNGHFYSPRYQTGMIYPPNGTDHVGAHAAFYLEEERGVRHGCTIELTGYNAPAQWWTFDRDGEIRGSAKGLVSWSGTSDRRYKNSIKPFDGKVSLENINKMKLVTFKYNSDKKDSPRRGVIAQQIQKIDPEYVRSTFTKEAIPDKFDSQGNIVFETKEKLVLDTNPLLMDAICAIQALSKEVDSLKEEIKKLKGK